VGSGTYSYQLLGSDNITVVGSIMLGAASATGGNHMDIFYTVETYTWNQGLLSFYFPVGFDSPNPSNFAVTPRWSWSLWNTTMFPPSPPPSAYVSNYVFSPDTTTAQSGPGLGGTVTVQVNGVYPGQQLSFQYGGINGFGYSGQNLTESVQVWANPQFYPPVGGVLPTPPPGLYGPGVPPPTPYIGGQVPAPAALPVVSVRPTITDSPTFTVSPTFTSSPTITPDATATPTFTITPPIAADFGHFYCYPNPFDRRLRPQLTFRFPAYASASMEVFNLLGNPVAHISQSDIYPSGFPGVPGIGGAAPGGLAVWSGQDDYGEVVAGGLYFVVLKTPGGTQVLKFTILN
jgi:hypothetical protein